MTPEGQADERDRRLARRQAEQERLHELDPHNVPKYLPSDDSELPDESYTAGWGDEDQDEDDVAWTALPWRLGKGKPDRSARVRMYVEQHPGATAMEVIRALDLSANPFGRSYGEPVWQAIRDDLVYDAAAGRNGRYVLYPTDLELTSMIAEAEAEPDLVKWMDMIDRMAERIRKQIADAADYVKEG